MAETRPEFKKTILIGLGGAGQLILTHLKRLFIDMYEILPPSMKLLSLDTDIAPISIRSALSDRQYSLDDQELLYMKVDQPIEFIKNSSVQNWFIKPLPAGSISKGAGAVRQVGRLAFFHHINEFQRRIDNLTTQLNAQQLTSLMENARSELGANTNFKLSGRDTEIYVCGSLAGGTGSGTFIDVGIFLRDQIPTALIHGFFLLNWIYRNKAFAYRVPGNVYAALAELDNLQNIKFGAKDFIPYTIQYAEKEVAVENPPYSLFHLVDGRNEFGENIHEVGELCETAANAIFLSIGSMGDVVASVVDNLLSHINVASPRIWNGKSARYSSFGVSSIYYPAIELHRWIALDNARKLCALALSEVQETATDPDTALQRNQSIQQDVSQMLGETQLNILNRTFVRDKLCPFQTPVAFPIQPFQISDKGFPNLIDFQFQQEEKNLENILQKGWEDNGEQFIHDTTMALELKLTEIKEDPKRDRGYLHGWLSAAIELVTGKRNEVTREINAEADNLKNLRQNADQLKSIAVQSRYVPYLGGARKRAVENWAVAIINYFNSMKQSKRFEYEQKFFNRILETLRSHKPSKVDEPSEVITALQNTQEVLHGIVAQENENLNLLKLKSNQILIGNANTVIYHAKEGNISLIDSVNLQFDQFKADKNINNPEDFLPYYNESPEMLVKLFVDYCADKLKDLKNVGLHEALETLGKKFGSVDAYIKEQFDHLFRLSSALWSFSQGKLNELQQLQYDKIVNLGVYDQAEGRGNYERFVTEVKGKYRIRSDHSFSTTGDPHRFWLLNYAAALPVCFLSDLDQSKKKYENEITPTYHIDKYFEMNVPDVFPVNDIANKALRGLGMAIVPGIDVIHDEKLAKGHKFTFNDPDYMSEKNLGQPKIWYLFRDMYDEVIEEFNQGESDNLLDYLIKALKTKVAAMNQDELRKAIESYTQKVRDKLASRDFSRLISARLTYRELKALEQFLDPRGYAMDIDRYIEGDM